MGDFLTRLSDRALGNVPVARPRALPLFDPGPKAPPETPAMAPDTNPAAASHAAPRSAAPAPRREASHPPPRPMIPPLQSAAAPASVPPRETPPPSDREPMDAGLPPHAAPAYRPAPEPLATVSATAPPRPAPPALVDEANPDAESPGPQPAPTFAVIVAPPSSRPLEDGRGAQAAARDSGEAARPQAPPTIHVTIGRVEVRAVMPPAPRERRPRQSTLMSLEDHLKQGRGPS